MTIDTQMSSFQMPVLRSLENVPSSRLRISLFGKPESDTFVDMLLSQQFDSDRSRYIERWGFDIMSEEFVKPSNKEQPKISSEDKENADVPTTTRRKKSQEAHCKHTPSKCKKRNDKENRCPKCSSPNKSLKMMKEKTYTKKGRQAHMTDYWMHRKISESSSCSDKEN